MATKLAEISHFYEIHPLSQSYGPLTIIVTVHDHYDTFKTKHQLRHCFTKIWS